MKKALSLTLGLSLLLGVTGNAFAQQKASSEPERPTIYMVANAHWDTQWRWTLQQSISEYLPNTLKQNLALMDAYPEYIFNLEGAVKYAMAKEYEPVLYEKMKERVIEGRWHLSGSGWDANDHNLPSAEACIRNYLYGQSFYKKEFGIKSTDIMLPDCFGFSYTIPTIAAHCGIIGFGTQKLQWRNNPFYEDGRKVPFNFGIWEGIDGSKIMALMDGGKYSWDPKEDITDLKDFHERLAEAQVPAAYKYFGTKSSRLQGDRGGSPTPTAVAVVDYACSHPKSYDVRFATSDQMYKDYWMDSRLKTYKGELLMDVHATGCYTSHTEIKKLNRQLEWLLIAAEGAGVIAEECEVMNYPSYTLDEAWRRVLIHQFHDDLPGTSIPEAYAITYSDYYATLNQLENLLRTEIASVASALDTRVKGTPVAVFNPLTVSNKSIATVTIDLPSKYKGVSVVSPDGKAVPCQILSREGDKAVVMFAGEVPSMGVAIFDVRPSGAAAKASKNLKASGKVIENKIYRVEVDNAGDICSIIDKRYGVEMVREGESFGYSVFTNNASPKWPAWEVIKDVIDQEPVKVDSGVKISVEELSAMRTVLKVEKSFGASSFVQRIILTDGAQDDRIDVQNSIDWNSMETLLKASFPVAFDAKEASYDLSLGSVRRGNNTITQYEVYAHQWADMTADDLSYGVTIMNDCKYGWDKPNDHTLRMTLLHTPSTGKSKDKHQATMDLGHHEFTYSIIGHKGALDPAAADIASDFLNQGKIAFVTDIHSGSAKQFSAVRSSSENIRVKAFKNAIDDDAVIVRIYNQSDKSAEAVLTFPGEILSAEEVNGLEESLGAASYSGKTLSVKAGAFQPKTYKLRLAASPVKGSRAQYKSVAIPANTVAITSDAFSAYGQADPKWHSYAAEILPSEFEVEGVPFSIMKSDYNNGVLCEGQQIDLPQGCSKVWVLAASTEGEREAVFNAGEDVEAHVGYFSGRFGAYGWKDYYDSFTREGRLAYVGTHRHDSSLRNEPYVNTWLFLVEVPVKGVNAETGLPELTLPKDSKVLVLSVTAQM